MSFKQQNEGSVDIDRASTSMKEINRISLRAKPLTFGFKYDACYIMNDQITVVPLNITIDEDERILITPVDGQKLYIDDIKFILWGKAGVVKCD